MQKAASDESAVRFYHIILQEDLLEGWTIIREWGYQGASGRSARKHFPDREAAEAAMMTYRDQQTEKGFQVVFMQGAYT